MQIGLINDNPVETRFIARTINGNPYYELAWSATSDRECMEFFQNYQPDLVIVSIALPHQDLTAFIKGLVATKRCAVLVSTESVQHNTNQVFQAMGAGALDVVTLPAPEKMDDPEHMQHLLLKIATVERLLNTGSSRRANANTGLPATCTPLIAIGSSTGGPAALIAILKSLPDPFPASLVIVQHLDAQFSQGFAEWLGEQSKMPVRIAREGGHPVPGIVHIAGTGDHLVLNREGKYQYSREPIEYVYRPSANEFFQSIVKNWYGPAIGVLLTGMGKDGASGLLAMRKKGYTTIAESEETCAVFGMPKAAIELGGADKILPLPKIAPYLIELIQQIRKGIKNA